MYSNLTQSVKKILLKFSLVITLVIPVLTGFSQPPLPSFLDINTAGVTDYIIPSDIVKIYFTISGAQGGSIQGSCQYVGGGSYLYKSNATVGNCYNQLVPGGTLRLITGQRGQSVTYIGGTSIKGAGGGGGSALLYKAPSSSDWVLLIAIGGGGGAGIDMFGDGSCNGNDGQKAFYTTSGGDGQSTGIAHGGAGGINGNGGNGSDLNSFGGGGAYTDGVTTGSQACNGKKGFPNGGAQANCNDASTYYGGSGFGSGGAGSAGGGGGGGYSGGGGGRFEGGYGGGGGTYVSSWVATMFGPAIDYVGDGEITLICTNGTPVPPVSLQSSTLPPLEVTGCNVNNSINFGFSTSETTVTLAQFNAAGGNIVPGGCNISSITYIDTLDAVNPTTKVNRTYRVTDGGGNIAIAKQVITVVRPTTSATISPTSQTNCINTVLSAITVNAINQFGITIQWYKGENAIFSQATIINGAISSSYTPPTTGIADLTYYFARITDGCGGAINKVATVNVISQPITWYKDSDNDGYSDSTYVGSPTCVKPGANFKSGTLGNDCNDNDATITPLTVWVHDADGDGYYTGDPFTGCLNGLTGYVKKTTQLSGDCNDNNNLVHPGAAEICNGIDDDCDGLTDVFCCPPSGIVYVKANATGGNNGTSWANAYKYLADALQTASRCNTIIQIWVAAGTYYPDEGLLTVANDRASTFSGRNHLAIYGGFAGTETLLSQRNLATNNTSYLNGNILQDGIPYHYSYNVIRLDGVDSTFVLDGFTIKEGNSAAQVGPVYQYFGGGIIVLSGNPTIQNCYITNNNSNNGGGIANVGGSAHFYNCVVANNTASGGDGGAVYNVNSDPWFVHCSIANNNVGVKIFYSNTGSSPTILNSIIRGAAPALVGSGIPTVGWSIIQDTAAWSGFGNSNADPLFLNEATGNLRLTPCSPAIDNGVSLTISPATDIAANARIINGTPDMGAYERTSVLILYVDSSANGNGDGSSWTNAYTSLQNALSLSCSTFTQIWVAKGTYKPSNTNDREAYFSLKNNMAVYGGFNGTETLLSQRNWLNNKTILSGDIGTLNNNSDNSYHVIQNFFNSLNNTSILDGFTVTNGNASNSIDYNRSKGAGVHNRNSSPTYYNCIFSGNTATSQGGGIFNESCSPLFVNCVVIGNTCPLGGGMYNVFSAPNITNCSFSGNQSTAGGAMYNVSAPVPVVANSILWGNSSGIQGAAATVSYSIVQPDATYLSQDSIFVLKPAPGLGANGDLRLRPCSPALNTGSNAALPVGITTDLAGNTRITQTTIDMGAYERPIFSGPYIYVDLAATGNNDGSSWANAYTNLSDALNDYNLCNANPNLAYVIYIAHGTYILQGSPTQLNRNGGYILGGFPHGGGTRNYTLYPVILKGNVQVIKSLQMEGVKVQKP